MNASVAILWPMIAQAFLTLALYPVLLIRRKAALASGSAAVADFRVPSAEPAESAAAVRSIANQFELPVLFFAVCLALHATGGASVFTVILAWIFALSRLVHAAVHLGTNDVRRRMPAFLVGFAAVFVLWVLFALHLAAAGR